MDITKALRYSTLPFAGLALLPAEAVSADYQTCLLKQMEVAAPDATVASLKAICSASLSSQPASDESITVPTPFEERVAVETKTRNELFVISPHKPNYVLPLSYNNTPNTTPYASKKFPYDKAEVKFQLSLKVAVAKGVLSEHGDIYVAYTNQSWWQAYNTAISSPFRETNHEPEIFYNLVMDHDLFGMKVRDVQFGLSHQSNGRSGDISRSWNRMYASMLLEKNNFYLHLKPWWRIPEDKKKSPSDTSGDDNPDITKYLGYGEMNMFYKLGEHNLSMMLRNNLRSDNKGAVQLGWSFPLSDANKLRGYVQYFNGYGESLIDYNASVSRLSIGFMLTDWL
ncbi:phospholipase A [Sansalvadorimonas verongulae]|uniref:phospholipase A n=1 Tax=Sansalvadorimonas verongulae TaxID=2172824 RepID=UPI0012BBEC56|nr:phospholipase A [Sansalvadorimonas verongulae]MTI13031.1 phospholipase [Sansalvadorimonas verongulae]